MTDVWVNSTVGAEILSQKAGRKIQPAYVRVLAGDGKIKVKKIDERTNVYHRGDLEAYHVKPLRGQRVEVRVRDKRSGKPGGRPRKTTS